MKLNLTHFPLYYYSRKIVKFISPEAFICIHNASEIVWRPAPHGPSRSGYNHSAIPHLPAGFGKGIGRLKKVGVKGKGMGKEEKGG